MGEFTRVDPKGKTDRQLLVATLRQSEAVHGCLEKHIAAQHLANLDATEKRLEMAKAMVDLKGDVVDIKQGRADDAAKIAALAQMFGAEQPPEGEKAPKGKGIATWPLWKVLTTVAGMWTMILVIFQLAVKLAPVALEYLMGLSP